MYTAAGGGGVGVAGRKEIFFRGKNFFHIPSHHTGSFDIPSLEQKKKRPPPPPPPPSILMRKIKHRQYDKMLQRLMFKIEN